AQRSRAKLYAQPTRTRLVDDPQEGLFRRWLPFGCVEEQDHGFVGMELRLHIGDAEWLRTCEGRILREVSGQRLVDFSNAGVDLGDTVVQRLLADRVALIRRLGDARTNRLSRACHSPTRSCRSRTIPANALVPVALH